jgi:hypothetical protein
MTTSYYQPLFNYLSNQHEIYLLESDMCEIINIVNNMKNKERIAILESEISRLKVANRNTNERLTAIEGKLGIESPKPPCSAITDALNNLVVKVERQRIKPEVPESVANNSAPNEGHLREHIDNFFNRSYDAYMETIEKKIVAEFGEDADISKKFKVMRNTYDVRNLKASVQPDFIPDWKDAPEDAVCVAMDGDGDWCWWKEIPRSDSQFGNTWIAESGDGLSDRNSYAGTCNNTALLPPDYWKGTLMMRPEAKQPEISHYEYELDLIQPPLEEKLHEPDYTHLLPEGYEFCQEADAEKWVKVEMNPNSPENEPIGNVTYMNINNPFKPYYRPIRPIQYKVTTHEIVDAIPDPYQPDWSKAPEGTVAHAWDGDGNSFWYIVFPYNPVSVFKNTTEPSNMPALPPDLDWKQSLRVKPSK